MPLNNKHANDFNIFYKEKNNAKEKVMFFIHGTLQNNNAWHKQFASSLFKGFHLIAIDLPGHGDSPAADNPAEAYHPAELAAYCVAAIEQLAGTKPYVLIGVSLGTNIIAEMLAHSIKPEGIVLISSCVIGGTVTFANIIKPGLDLSKVYADDWDEFFTNDIVDNYFEPKSIADKDLHLNRIAKEKPFFRPAILHHAMTGSFADEIALLQKSNLPLLIIFGDTDKFVPVHYLDNVPLRLWQNKIHIINNAGHYVQLDAPQVFNELLKNYLKECNMSTTLSKF
jgi:pimeloyl-ACP methyl ester carboxylesterase